MKEHQAGLPVVEICRKHGISDAMFYTWRLEYGGLEVSEAKRLKALEEENRKLTAGPRRIVSADGSNSRARASALRPARTSSTSRRRNSGG